MSLELIYMRWKGGISGICTTIRIKIIRIVKLEGTYIGHQVQLQYNYCICHCIHEWIMKSVIYCIYSCIHCIFFLSSGFVFNKTDFRESFSLIVFLYFTYYWLDSFLFHSKVTAVIRLKTWHCCNGHISECALIILSDVLIYLFLQFYKLHHKNKLMDKGKMECASDGFALHSIVPLLIWFALRLL